MQFQLEQVQQRLLDLLRNKRVVELFLQPELRRQLPDLLRMEVLYHLVEPDLGI